MARATQVKAAALAGLCICYGCIGQPEARPDNGVIIGGLLPFTGPQGASGSNIERGMLLAAERINEAGGVADRPIVVEARNTQSGVEPGLSSAEALLSEGAAAVVGPENLDLARSLVPRLQQEQTLMVSGGIGSALPGDSDVYWYRAVPPAREVAQTLSERIEADGHEQIAIFRGDSAFGRTFASLVDTEFERLGGTAVLVPFTEGTVAAGLQQAFAESPDAVVLAALPGAAASLVRESTALNADVSWYLAPTLRDRFFVRNIPSGVLDGAVGVAPALPADASQFAEDFRARWDGLEPAPSTYYYYDAVVAVALALEYGRAEDFALPQGLALGDALRVVSAPGGRIVTWDQISEAFELVRAGEDIDYRGTSGALDFDADGDVGRGLVNVWQVVDDRIESE